MRLLSFFLTVLLTGTLAAQPVEPTQVRAALEELNEFLAIPNFGLNRADIDRNLRWLDAAFQQRGFATQTLETTGNPLFFAAREVGDELPTILFYMHLDGQAVDPGKWDQSSPYQPVVKKRDANGAWTPIDTTEWNALDREWRVFARSASDDKGPIVGFLHAMDALRADGQSPAFNVKVILDAEEELGSRPLAAAVERYRDLLDADALLIHDGPVHLSGQPSLMFGCRGITSVNLTVYGPGKPQHSGHYGNYAPNPVFRLAHLLASMKDEDGRVLIDGYYDGIDLDAATRAVLAGVPDDTTQIFQTLQINQPERVGANYQEALQYPSFNARGIRAAYVGAQARTVVPDVATVAIDMRLVPESDPAKLVAALRRHIEAQGYHLVDREPTLEERLRHPKLAFLSQGGVTLPFRTDLDAPIGTWTGEVIRREFEQEPVRVRIMGGTVPIAGFIRALDVPALVVPVVNSDNNQHSPNENLRLGNLAYGIRLFRAILGTEASELVQR